MCSDDTATDESECREIASWYTDVDRFRSTIDMARYRFGQGEYRYFGDPVPEPITAMRATFYRQLLPVAREWAFKLGDRASWPDTFEEWIDQCHTAGQKRPTPILLSYGPGDWNALHRDLYGELVFPLQVVIGLDRPRLDHAGESSCSSNSVRAPSRKGRSRYSNKVTH